MANLFPGATQIPVPGGGGFFPRSPAPTLMWSVIHTTANATLSAEGHARAQPIGAGQVTASFWVNRDGSIVQSMQDPAHQGPWTNGVWQSPDTSNPRIAAAFAGSVNPNVRTLVSIENVALEPGSPITAAQEASCARIIKWAHDLIGMPITRQTVIGHYQITSRDRPNCPARDKSVIDRIVAMANGATPPAGGGDDVKYTEKIYPAARPVTAKGGVTHGYKYSDEPNKDFNFAAGSATTSASEVTIDPTPPDWLAGPYQMVSAGPAAGYLVANSQLNLGAVPAPGGDCSDELQAAEDEIVSLKESNAALQAENETLSADIQEAADAFQTLSELGK